MSGQELSPREEIAGAIVAQQLDGAYVGRDGVNASEGTHDLDICLADGRRVALEGLGLSKRKRIEIQAANGRGRGALGVLEQYDLTRVSHQAPPAGASHAVADAIAYRTAAFVGRPAAWATPPAGKCLDSRRWSRPWPIGVLSGWTSGAS
jgi:hypothetical protein